MAAASSVGAGGGGASQARDTAGGESGDGGPGISFVGERRGSRPSMLGGLVVLVVGVEDPGAGRSLMERCSRGTPRLQGLHTATAGDFSNSAIP